MATQLRVFTIEPRKTKAWLDGWTRGVVQLGLKWGFSSPAAWVVEERDELLWLLR